MKPLAKFLCFLAVCMSLLSSPNVAYAAAITSLSYGPSGSTVGTFVASSDMDFVVFTPITAITTGSTITLTLPSGMTLTSANIATTDFTIGQATQGLCVVAGADTVPTAVTVNESNRTITLTVASASLSLTVGLLGCGTGQVTIKTSALLGGNEIRHPTPVTTSGVFQVSTSVGDSGSLSNVSFVADEPHHFKVTGTASNTAGETNELTITAYDQYDNTATGYTGSKSLTFSGLSNAVDGTVPTIEGTNQGSATSVSFSNGVSAANAATLIAYKAESASVDVSDGSINSAGSTSYDLDLTVTAAVATTLTKNSGDTQTAAVNTALSNDLVVKLADDYDNPVSGSTVSFTVSSAPSGASGQLLSASSDSTDGPGLANTALTLGNTAGSYQVQAAVSGVGSVTFAATATDNTAPVISSISVTPSSTSVIVTWSSDEAASSKLNYGVTSSYGSSTTESDTTPRVTSHSLQITGLVECTGYHLQVVSTDYSTNQGTSSDQSFTTTGCLGSSTVLSSAATAITTASGGSLSLLSSGKGLSLTVPSAFSGSDANFQIKQLSKSEVFSTAPLPGGLSNITNYVYELDALSSVATKITSFSQPITVTILYSDIDLADVSASTLRIYRWTGSVWSELSSCTVDTSAKSVMCTTTAFSVLALAGQLTSSSSSSGSSGNSGSTSAAQPPVCSTLPPGSAPWLYAGEANGTNQATLYFSDAGDPVSKYVLEYGLSPSNYTYGSQNIGGKGSRSYLVGHLNSNTKYYFRVRASNGCATGSWSNEIAVKTLPWGVDLDLSRTLAIKKTLEDTQVSEGSEVVIGTAAHLPTYTLKLKLTDPKGKPLKNAAVTLHSTPKTGKTDQNGEVIFDGVEYGNHELAVESGSYNGQQSLFVAGEKENILLDIRVSPQPLLLRLLSMSNLLLLIIITALIFLIKRQKTGVRRKNG